MISKDKYASIFKINGVPILPPLMSDEKRQELLRYKELAIALEMKLKLESESKNSTNREEQVTGNESEQTADDEYLKVSNLLQEKCSDGKENVSSRKSFVNLEKSDTFIYDIITNTVIIPYDNDVDGKFVKELKNESGGQPICKDNNTDKKLLSTERPPSSEEKEKCSSSVRPNTVESRIPSISIKPPTPESGENKQSKADKSALNKQDLSPKNKSQSLKTDQSEVKRCRSSTVEVKAPKRSTTSPSLKSGDNCGAPLIRSNSFTLESPSKALLQHMVKQLKKENIKSAELIKTNKTQVENSNKNTNEIKTINSVPKRALIFSPPKAQRKGTIEPKISTLLITNSSVFRNKKSPYETKPSSRSKLLKKHKSPIVKSVSSVSIKHRSRHSAKKSESAENTEPNLHLTGHTPNMKEFSKLEESQKLKLLELIKNQKEEHRRMQEIFEKQQKLLLMELLGKSINECDLNEDNYGVPDKFYQSRETNSSIVNAKNSLLSSKLCSELGSNKEYPKNSPRRKLFATEDTPVRCKETPVTQVKKREEAATIINAYVRGYLVRRLFKTSYIQKIVQTIRDTLLFVLELHMETRFNETDENIKLKARLLQQLTSSSYTLHKIFFELSPKERMDIIARDRVYLKHNIRSPRTY